MGLFGDPWNPKTRAVPITADIRRTSIYNTSAVEAQTWNGTTVSARVVPDDTMYSASRADRPSLRPLRTGHAPLLRRFERGRQDRDRTREQVFAEKTENGIRNFGKSVSGKVVWANKKALTKQREEAIIKEIKECGIKCEKINLVPRPIDTSRLELDEKHIQQRAHNVTKDEAVEFIKSAKFSATGWHGKRERYYGRDGCAYVDVQENIIKTAYGKDEFDDTVKKALEVYEKYEG